jgi:hypothetical protein
MCLMIKDVQTLAPNVMNPSGVGTKNDAHPGASSPVLDAQH